MYTAHRRVPGLSKMFMGKKGHHNGHQRNKNTLLLPSLRSILKVGEIMLCKREQLHCNLNTTGQMKIKPLHSVVSYPLTSGRLWDSSFTNLHVGIPGSRTLQNSKFHVKSLFTSSASGNNLRNSCSSSEP